MKNKEVIKWFELRNYIPKIRPYTFIIGGRGIGKTFGTIDLFMDETFMHGSPFIYMRNKSIQLKESATQFGNPFKKWNKLRGRSVQIVPESEHYIISEKMYEGKKLVKETVYGYACSLSTFENLRGVDLSDVKYVLFDEFIELSTLTFDQFATFSNFYETVNRDRELEGEEPLKVIFLSNAQKLDNPILSKYGLITIIEEMLKNGIETRVSRDCTIMLPKSNVSELKKDTALYRMTAGTEFYDEAINNQFANDSFTGIKKRKIIEYVGVCKIDDIYLYKHKHDTHYYLTNTRVLNVPEFSSRDQRLLFMHHYGLKLIEMYAAGRLYFENFTIKSKIMDILNY